MKINKKHNYFKVAIPLTVVAVAGLAYFFLANNASAVKGWDAGNIMEDSVMSNNSSMSTTQIQSFLNSKVPNCDTNGQQLSEFGGPDLNGDGKVQRWEWGKDRHNQTKFICLKDYTQNGKSAAQVIKDVSDKYHINPQVLIVLLQKEQGLVTDSWPLNIQYRSATGYGCPDTAPCDTQYYGLTNQLDWAAKMFRSILDNNPGWYTPYETGNNYIQYNPSSSCGGTTVYIKNRATQALYNYTPYQPNKGALDAGWGSAACGAYGNRNFYLYFTDWFGNTRDEFRYNSENLVDDNGVIKNSAVSVGQATKVIPVGDKIYNLYADTAGKSLRLSYWNGSKWSDSIMDGKGSSVPGALSTDMTITEISGFNYNGRPQVFYYDQASKTLRHAFMINSQWRTETLDGSTASLLKRSGDVGSSISSMQYGKNGIQLFYYNATDKDLEHTWWDAANRKWRTETLDGSTASLLKRSGDVGSEVKAMAYSGDIQLFYHSTSSGELLHSWWNSSKRAWHTERMDGDTNTILGNYINAGKSIDMAIFKNKLFVGYYDDATDFPGNLSSWRLAYWSGTAWVQHTLEGGGDGMSNPTKSMPPSDLSMNTHLSSSLQLIYRGAENQLRHVWVRQ
jgi:hypothetical protein